MIKGWSYLKKNQSETSLQDRFFILDINFRFIASLDLYLYIYIYSITEQDSRLEKVLKVFIVLSSSSCYWRSGNRLFVISQNWFRYLILTFNWTVSSFRKKKMIPFRLEKEEEKVYSWNKSGKSEWFFFKKKKTVIAFKNCNISGTVRKYFIFTFNKK